MHAAPSFFGMRNQRHHLLVLGHRATIRHSLATSRTDLFDNLLRRIRRASAITRAAKIIDHNLGPTPRQLQRISPAQAAASTGYDRDASFERNGHAGSSCVRLTARLTWGADGMVGAVFAIDLGASGGKGSGAL